MCTTFCFCFDLPCDSWGHKELDTTELLNWTELNCMLTTKNLVSINHHTADPSYPFLSIVSIYMFVFVWFVYLFCLFSLFHVWVKSYGSEIRFLKREQIDWTRDSQNCNEKEILEDNLYSLASQ